MTVRLSDGGEMRVLETHWASGQVSNILLFNDIERNQFMSDCWYAQTNPVSGPFY